MGRLSFPSFWYLMPFSEVCTDVDANLLKYILVKLTALFLGLYYLYVSDVCSLFRINV